MLIALLGCSKAKIGVPAPAARLYAASSLFRKALSHVTRYADRIHILSAKYGLVDLDQVLEPYDATFADLPAGQQEEWARRVLARLQTLYGEDLSHLTFEFYCGKNYQVYLDPLLRSVGARVYYLVAGLRIGERRRYYGSGGIKTIPPLISCSNLSYN